MNELDPPVAQPASASDSPRRSRRRFIPRLSLRATMVVVLVLGGGLGWIARSARIQRDAVSAVQKAGGTVRYAWIWNEDEFVQTYGAPEWWSPIVRLIGPDYFQVVTSVDTLNARAAQLDDDLMAQIGRFDRLEHLRLINAESISAAGVAHLKSLKLLAHLIFSGMNPEVYDAGLVHLKGLTKLKTLTLRSPHCTSAALDPLSDLSELESLDLDESGVDDLASIRGLKKLKRLYLRSTSITDSGLGAVAELVSLENLFLNNDKITDAGLVHLKDLKKLRFLHLTNTGITDAGLVHLQDMESLRELNLNGTMITDAGLIHLQKLNGLPNLYLNDTNITNAGLATLAAMKGLHELWLNGTMIDDDGFRRLIGHKALKRLNVANTRVTNAGLFEMLQKSPSMRLVPSLGAKAY